LTTDLYLKIFVQTNTSIDKENAQILFVWRILPPFGSLQVAFQRGTSELGQVSTQAHPLFTKLSWVFRSVQAQNLDSLLEADVRRDASVVQSVEIAL
jgi:hypothetical protein